MNSPDQWKLAKGLNLYFPSFTILNKTKSKSVYINEQPGYLMTRSGRFDIFDPIKPEQEALLPRLIDNAN
jgi:hypothetical protein